MRPAAQLPQAAKDLLLNGIVKMPVILQGRAFCLAGLCLRDFSFILAEQTNAKDKN
jgi:hypothetical protein